MEDLSVDRDRSIDGLCVFPLCDKPETNHLRLPVCETHILKTYRLASMMIRDALPDLKPKEIIRNAVNAGSLGVVYFLRLGSLVKIGFTTNLESRMKVVPHEELLATMPGTMKDERRLHRQFADLRQTGEWFRHEGDLPRFIQELRDAA